jgi:hypothetical protein
VPIEVGWAYVDQATGAVVSEGHLIRPPPQWSINSCWDPDAEKLHGIMREQLRAEGRPAFDVVQRMNDMLAG